MSNSFILIIGFHVPCFTLSFIHHTHQRPIQYLFILITGSSPMFFTFTYPSHTTATNPILFILITGSSPMFFTFTYPSHTTATNPIFIHSNHWIIFQVLDLTYSSKTFFQLLTFRTRLFILNTGSISYV